MSRDTSPLGQAWLSHTYGRNEQALQEFEKLAAASPEDLDVLYGLGMAQRRAGQLEDAVATFKKILGLLDNMETEDEDEHNRIEMLTRMTTQQITFAQGKG
jgi:Flp pilus assembly protein TadD